MGMDRIVDFTFGSGDGTYHLILELYAQVGCYFRIPRSFIALLDVFELPCVFQSLYFESITSLSLSLSLSLCGVSWPRVEI